jgi:hypothetical protein
VRLRSLIQKKEKEHKMKRLQLAVGLLMTLAFSRIEAQTIDFHATIPFEFRMGQTVMAAGDYTVHHSNGLLSHADARGQSSV